MFTSSSLLLTSKNIEKAKNREEFSEFKFELHESEGEEFDREENWN